MYLGIEEPNRKFKKAVIKSGRSLEHKTYTYSLKIPEQKRHLVAGTEAWVTWEFLRLTGGTMCWNASAQDGFPAAAVLEVKSRAVLEFSRNVECSLVMRCLCSGVLSLICVLRGIGESV